MEPEGSLPRYKSLPPVPVLSQINPVDDPHPTSWRSVLILLCHLRLGLPSGLLTSGFTTKKLCMHPSPPHTCYIPRPSPFQFDDPNNIRWEYTSLSFSLRSLLHTPVTPSLLGPNILLKHPQPMSLLNVTDQVSHPYTATNKTVFLYILIFIYIWTANRKTKDSAPNDSKHSLTSVCSLFLPE